MSDFKTFWEVETHTDPNNTAPDESKSMGTIMTVFKTRGGKRLEVVPDPFDDEGFVIITDTALEQADEDGGYWRCR
jgi:hypothetical protein